MEKKKSLLGLIAVLIFVNFTLSFAQESPKVGLVLSGGGAKGIAHIGVIRAMEQAGIRPDYIAGTSMGAVVGGLYAIGYSADDIEDMVLNIDWDIILSNQVPLNYISFEEKEYFNRFLLEFGVKGDSIVLPSGLIEGQMLGEALQYFCWPATEYNDFDDFPIPFRCIATDVGTGLPVVFKNGSLPFAIRASMALPSAFTAVKMGETLLVDGGVTNNFPVDEVLKMGADYVIGVNVSTTLDEALPESMADILMSLAMIPSTLKLEDHINLCDIYIEPDLGSYSTASFGHAQEIMNLGDATGIINLPKFESLAEKINKPVSNQKVDVSIKEYVLSDIQLDGNYLFSNELIRGKLGLEIGDKVSRDDIEHGIRQVYGVNGFTKVTYGIEPVGKGACNLKVYMVEKEKQRLFASVHVDNLFSAGIVLNVVNRDLIGKESRTILGMDISKNPRFRFDYYKYVGKKKRLAFNLRYDYSHEQLPYYEDGEDTDISINRSHVVGIHAITTQSLKRSFWFGIQTKFRGQKSKFGISAPEEIKKINEHLTYLQLTYFKNRLNNRNFPTAGGESILQFRAYTNSKYKVEFHSGVDSLYNVDGIGYLSKDDVQSSVDAATPDVFGTVLLRTIQYFPLAKKMQLVPYISAGLTVSSEPAGHLMDSWNLGGYQQVTFEDVEAYGLNYAELTPVNFGVLGVKLQRVFQNKVFLTAGANFLATYDYYPIGDFVGSVQDVGFDEASMLGYGVELSIKTRLGPISGGMTSNTDDGFVRYFFSFGFSMNYSD